VKLPTISRRGILVASLLATTLLLAGIGVWAHLHSPKRGLPYHDSFANGEADEWTAFGGTWAVVNGSMRNDSDERGAKLITGSPYWRDYSVEADVMLLGLAGDAGLIVRSSNEEQGVDAYSGYYAGVRNFDNSLVLGRAAHGWMEDVVRLNSLQTKVHALQWYHLKVLVYGCEIVATADIPSKADPTTVAIEDKDCASSGRIGLRSFSSGGVWRNVVVRPATREDLVAMLARAPLGKASAVLPSTGENPEHPGFYSATPHGDPDMLRSDLRTQPISSLRLVSWAKPTTATVHGVVILTSPALYIQDSTGGISVPHPTAPPLKVGDEVEVTGQVTPGAFSSALEHANVRVLWEGAPMPAVSVAASQAATGAFDATFIEVEGRLRAKSYGPDNTLIYDFDAGPQSFRAIMNRGRGESVFGKLKLNSLLRLRGVCVVSPAYTQNLTPFVLLLRSTDDMNVLAGPPWWSAGNVIAIAIAILLLALVANFFYSRAERWRLRAVLEERERLAHEMHDTIAQSFAGIGFQLEAIRNGIPSELPTTHQQLDLASALVRHSHEEARRSIATLRPESLESGDLLTALEICARRMVAGGAVKIVTSSSGDIRQMPLRLTDTLYRIGQEAIANSIRHAHPSTITISVEFKKNMVHLLLADDGVGFTPGGDLRGFGVRGMRKRAAFISAAIQILSEPGKGTTVRVVAPLPPRLTLASWPKFLWKFLREYPSNAETTRQPHPNSYRG